MMMIKVPWVSIPGSISLVNDEIAVLMPNDNVRNIQVHTVTCMNGWWPVAYSYISIRTL